MTEQQVQKGQNALGTQNVQALVSKIVELQEKLVESQEKNVMLSTQLREMEMMARDGDDLKGELANHSAMLSDKSRENKRLHQDLARLTTTLEEKLAELEELRAGTNDLQHQLKQRESERDLLAVMLTEKEQQQQTGRSSGTYEAADSKQSGGFFGRFKGKP
ncbi:MAG: hypothetical protein K8F91_26830 [Candidatus Obscuribacterales bacterium]|nr:hypothetical protein [Candidatus Obscuribacterales bacterium]